MPPKGSQKAKVTNPSTPKAKPKPQSTAAAGAAASAKLTTTITKRAKPEPVTSIPASRNPKSAIKTGMTPDSAPRKKKEAIITKRASHDANAPPQIEVKYEGESAQAQQVTDGVYGHTLMLKAASAFTLIKTVKFLSGQFEGCEAIILQPAKPFEFLKLPKEARAKIYSYYFAPNRIVGNSITVEGKRNGTKDMWAKMYSEGSRYRVGLLAVNQEILEEAREVFFNHPLRFESTTAVMDFLGQVDNGIRSHIRKISIKQFAKTTARNAMHFLAESANITSLYIESTVHCGNDPAKAAKEFHDSAYKFLEAVGGRKGDKTAGVDVLIFGRYAFTHKAGEHTKKEPWEGELVKCFKAELKARLT